MTRDRDPFLRILLAILPVLISAVKFRESLFLGSLITLSFWGTVIFFSVTRSWFPARLWSLTVILWLMTAAQIGYDLHGLDPLWVISLFLLLPVEWEGEGRRFRPKKQRKLLGGRWRFAMEQLGYGFGFWIMILYIGISQEVLGDRFFVWTFKGPVGAFLLLALAAILWQNQPGRSASPSLEGRV